MFQLLIKDPVQFLTVIPIIIIPLLISISFHEWAHGYVAYKFGDPTPKMYGRLTLNPFAHLDPVGTLMLFLVGIGWAKPVPINILNIPDRTKQMLVAIAGPGMNILLAIVFSFISVSISTFYKHDDSVFQILSLTLDFVVKINLVLATFNMIPVPPLDGSRVLAWILPENISAKYYFLEPYGIALIFLILFTGGFRFIIGAASFLQTKLAEVIKLVIFGNLM